MEQLDIVLSTVRTFITQMGQFLPNLLAAVIILVLGWLIAKLLRYTVLKSLKLINFGALTEKAGMDTFLKRGGIRKTTIDILALLVYWLMILVTLLVAFNTLGLTVVSGLVSRITQFIPSVIVAVLILTIGMYFARFVSESVIAYGKNVGLGDAEFMGRLTRYAIMIFVVIIALGEMNIGAAILYPAFLILFGGIVLALALAFGLGGQKWAAGQLESFFGKKTAGRRR